MRSRGTLLAGLLAGGAAQADPPGDLRDEFGLKPQSLSSCGDGRAPECAIATDPLDEATPYALSSWLPMSYLVRLPVGAATHEVVASYAIGASRDGAGAAFGGATGLDNRWTIEGAPADSVRTGAADTRLPLAFLEGIYVSAGGFSARDRASLGGAIDARLRRGTEQHEIASDVWLELARSAKERPLADGSYLVRTLSLEPGPQLTASLVGTGPLGRWLDGAWYAAGLAPSVATTRLAFQAGRLIDTDGDGAPDRIRGALAVETVERTSERTVDYAVPAMARLGLDRGPHRVELSLLGSVQRDARFLAGATLPAAGVDRTAFTGDAIASWRGAWPSTTARVQASWHRSDRNESARDAAAAGIPQLATGYVPAKLPDDPVLAAACDDSSPDDRWKQIINCPVQGALFASGGAGPLIDTVGDRASARADLARRIAGHAIRAGAMYEDSRLTTTTAFTGSELVRALVPGTLDHRRFYRGSCGEQPSEPCDYADRSRLDYHTLYAAAYAEDTLALGPGLSVDAGLRWELMWVGPALHVSDQIAPRVGAVWDPLGGGRSRVWASAGRAFAMLPAGLGATVIRRDATVDDFEIGGVAARVHDAGSAFRVAPGIRSVAQDEVTLGGEVALAGALRATAWAQARFIGHGLETTADGFENPEPEATRESETAAVALELVKPGRVAIRAGVLWGRAVGTWTGLYDPRQGFNLLQSSDWADATNLAGRLPSDPGGRVFVEAEQRGTLGPVETAVATRFTVASGRPRNVLADGELGIVQLLPRGSAGRDAVVAQANLRLAARWRGIAITLDVLNLFDRREATNLDEVYSADAVRPISGGEPDDLVFLKNEAGQPAQRRTGFRLPIAFQDPLSISLGVHRAF